MKILHLCLSAFYIEGMSYQENLLPLFHQKMGHEVRIISSLQTFSKDGEYTYEEKATEYDNQYGIRVKKLDYRKPVKIARRIKTYIGTYQAIESFRPDIIFMHGIQFIDSCVVVRYMKKHPDVRLYADNHSDFSNSARNWVSKHIQHKILWRLCAQNMEPYVIKFWGVLPARVDFLIDMYKLPKEKVDLLVMGADDEAVKSASGSGLRKQTREKYGFADHAFLIVTGGKIDQWKKQTLLLMDAVNQIADPDIQLLVFGSVTPELKEDVGKRCSDRVKYIGWVDSADSYSLFAAGDAACFPGRHSVFWEQAAGQGIPMICKFWAGTTHVNRGGNVIFLHEDSVREISDAITKMKEEYSEYKSKAVSAGPHFLYSKIAERSIEDEVSVRTQQIRR